MTLSVLLTTYYLGDQIKNIGMGSECSMFGEEEGEVHTGFWWGNLKERDHLEHLGLIGRIILKWAFQKYFGGVKWIYVAQVSDG